MRSVVLLSGGIDSTVCLAITLTNGNSCELALTANYGQKHFQAECAAATQIADHYSIPHSVVDIRPVFGGSRSSLTGYGSIPQRHADAVDSTFVPGRNLMLISVGVVAAAGVDAQAVVIGANYADVSGYPDCRPRFISSMDAACRDATEDQICVWAPLIKMPKREVVDHGIRLDAPLELTWSCYRGGNEPCNRCGACESRNEALACRT